MDIGLQNLTVLMVIFFSVLLRSVFGFGDAIFSMPILSFLIGIKSAAPLMALVCFSIAVFMLVQKVKFVNAKEVFRLSVSSLVGIPFGIYFLKDFDEEIIKTILGGLIICFSTHKLKNSNNTKRKIKSLHVRKKNFSSKSYAYLIGFVAGILGGAYNTNGPPIVYYGMISKWKPVDYTATLQGYFVLSGLFVLAGHGIAGHFTREILHYYLLSLPLLVLAGIVGKKVSQKISINQFLFSIYLLFFMVGFLLFFINILSVFT
jgi:uncharacterized membrane protein YfcA